MGVELGAQTISVTAASLCGLLAGLLYDLLRALRSERRRAFALVCDLAFCLSCTGSLFLVGMAFCEGKLGVWECCSFLGVFTLYLVGVSPSVAPVFGSIRKSCEKILIKGRKTAK